MKSKSSGTSALSLLNASKFFGSVVALSDGCIELEAGRIHALVGENGAGKSTLVKILAGLYIPDSGKFLVDGQQVAFRSVADSKAAGISIIYQEPTLFPDLSVSENIFIGRQPKDRFGLINRTKMNKDAQSLFSELGVSISSTRLAEGLSIADQQIIEIAKAISLEARILVMDEPTAALSGAEVQRLFVVARKLRDKGVAILFISHRFDEVFDLCDEITVMRDGAFISTHKTNKTNVDEIVQKMVGREITSLYPKGNAVIGEVMLEVVSLSRDGDFKNINLNVRSGEIVALAGLVGAGRTEVARSIFGIDKYNSGSVIFNGKKLKPGHPTVAIRAGIGFVPEDRRKQGVVLELPVGRNITITLRKHLARLGLIPSSHERQTAQMWADKLKVKSSSLDSLVSTLSGGNQQKIVLAKWLATEPKLLIVDEPTRGIDVGTKSEVHKLLSDLADKGIAILIISSELPEVLGMADRIYVLREGRISKMLTRSEATPQLVMQAATTTSKEAK